MARQLGREKTRKGDTGLGRNGGATRTKGVDDTVWLVLYPRYATHPLAAVAKRAQPVQLVGAVEYWGKEVPCRCIRTSAERRLRGCSGALTDCVCRPGILVRGEPGTGEVSGEYSRAKRGRVDVHDYLCWCWTQTCDKVVALREHVAVLALFALYSRLEVMVCVISNGAKRWC